MTRRRPAPAPAAWRPPARATAPAALVGALVALALGIALAALGIAPAGAGAGAVAAKPRVSLPAIERQAMCVTCKVALNESQSPQANLERAYIKELIAKGDGEGEIKRALVAQFGPTVLGLPSAHGFDLAAYLVPAAVVAGLLATFALLLPRWRRRARAARGGGSGSAPLAPADAARLEADLARFD